MLTTLTLAGIALAATLAPQPAFARDRPGTPNEVQVWEREWSLAERPRLQVSFRNTAKEKVHFWFEWTVNGEPQSKADLQPMLSCPDANTYFLICSLNYLAFPRQGGREAAASDTENRELPYEILVKDAAFDTEYCFRFMAQDEDGVHSEIWSAWACKRTRPAPPPPGKPAVTQVTPLPGSSGKGEIGGPVPDRVLVEWTGGGSNTAGYAIEQQLERGWFAHADSIRSDAQPLEAAVTVDELPTLERPTRFRVCAWNVGGRTCSDGVSTATYAAQPKVDTDAILAPAVEPLEAAPQGDAHAAPPAPAADTRVESDAIVAPPPERIAPPPPPPPPAAPPAAEGRRRGPYGAP
jgi:hypothetical protein